MTSGLGRLLEVIFVVYSCCDCPLQLVAQNLNIAVGRANSYREKIQDIFKLQYFWFLPSDSNDAT